MNIVFVNGTKIWSGVKTWTLTLSKALAQRGHRVSIVAYPGVFVDVCQQHGLEVLPLRFGFDGNPWAIMRLVSWFSTHQADWVVTNIDKDIYVAGIAARWVGARVLNHVGAPGDVKPKGKQAIVRAKLVDRFLNPSHASAAGVQQRAPWLPPQRMDVLYYPVDTERFRPRPRAAARVEEPLRIGITGRLAAVKGHRTLIEAIRLLPPEVLASVRVDIAGNGPLEHELRSMVQQAHLAGRVQFLGFVTDPERFLQQLDIAVFPSRWESLCVALLEAMACGLPVVASAAGGIPEVVRDGQNGLLVQPDDAQGLAHALTHLCRNPRLREELGRNARQDIEQRFATEVIAAQFETLYT